MGLLLFGCQIRRTERTSWYEAMPEEMMSTSVQSVRGVMLLPLTGKSAEMGKAFQNSAMMALQEQLCIHILRHYCLYYELHKNYL